MKKILTIIAIAVSLTTHAQNIDIPFEVGSVIIDGKIVAAEWQNADSIKLAVSPNDTVTVFFKHDMVNMYFAFAGKLESNSLGPMFPEVLFDPQLVRGSSWVNGQWWFHVSATDCENDGGYGVYNNCNASQPDWTGAPNVLPGQPYTDSIEFKIPYSKIGFNPVTQYNLGIAFVMTNTNGIYELWPNNADKDVPSTWSDARIIKFPVSITTTNSEDNISIYPNPAHQNISVSNVTTGSVVSLIDALGRVVYSTISTENILMIETSSFAKGLYHLQITNGSDRIIKKVVLN